MPRSRPGRIRRSDRIRRFAGATVPQSRISHVAALRHVAAQLGDLISRKAGAVWAWLVLGTRAHA
jgi:hypothetical protein